MARQTAQMKGGFFPVPIPALQEVLDRIEPPDENQKFYVCDPCCGEGEALATIAAHYKCDPRRVFGVELETGRHALASERLPSSNILHANFLSCDISDHSFSFMWLNPPFDDEIGGGGRVEHDFLKHATRTLVSNGIMALCCPEDVANRWDVNAHFATFYDDVSIASFPSEHRRFKEVVVIGRKIEDVDYKSREIDYELRARRYVMPRGYYPFKFHKSELTAEELTEALALSPLSRLIQSTPLPPLPSPPLSLGKGHVALLLASGNLDGMVYPPGEPPHLVRGTAKKIEYISSIEDDSDEETGKEKTVVTKSERITLTIRTLSTDGTIQTFLDKPIDAVQQEKSDAS